MNQARQREVPARVTGRRRWVWLTTLGASLAVALSLAAIAVLEGDVPDAFADLTDLARRLLARFGPAASLFLLYIEESGVPLPVPGDVYVLYLGSLAKSPPQWAAAWLGVVAVVTAGASNLYLISRRWGRRLVRGRVGAALHLTPGRLATAERWFARWGPLAVIFGRHIPGFRIPITVAAGTFGVHYPTFAASVAVSSAIWAGIWFWIGAHFGTRIGGFLSGNSWTFALGVLFVLAVVAATVVQVVRDRPQPAQDT
jgi:membrane protein DedA with SNARE-associated domain